MPEVKPGSPADPLAKPWWLTRTFFSALAGLITAVGGLWAYFFYEGNPAKVAEVTALLATVSAAIANIGSVLAEEGSKSKILGSPSVETKGPLSDAAEAKARR